VSAFGGRKRGNGRSDLPLNAEINVTSLVDVAFTLLVIFIITAPILQGGINVSVPKADVQPITASNKKPFFVTVNRQGQVFIEDTKTTVTEFQKSFPPEAIDNIKWYPPVPAGLEDIEGKILDRVQAS